MTPFALVETPTIGDALHRAAAHLRESGIGSGNVEAALLLSQATGLDRLGLLNHTSRPLSPQEHALFEALINRRALREPLQHITGHVEFMGLDFEVSPEVLIPRPDTEILVEAVLDIEETIGPRDEVLVADVGTGSGAIAIALASYLRYVRVKAVDISSEALAVATRNLEKHGVADRVDLVKGDGLEPLQAFAGKFDYVLSNPPYISLADLAELEPEVRDFEPPIALTPGEDPLLWYRRFADQAPQLLLAGGMLVLEVGIHQAQDVIHLLESSGAWKDLTIQKDLGGIERVVLARVAK